MGVACEGKTQLNTLAVVWRLTEGKQFFLLQTVKSLIARQLLHCPRVAKAKLPLLVS